VRRTDLVIIAMCTNSSGLRGKHGVPAAAAAEPAKPGRAYVQSVAFVALAYCRKCDAIQGGSNVEAVCSCSSLTSLVARNAVVTTTIQLLFDSDSTGERSTAYQRSLRSP